LGVKSDKNVGAIAKKGLGVKLDKKGWGSLKNVRVKIGRKKWGKGGKIGQDGR